MRFFVFENFVWFIIRSLAPVWPDWIIFERPVQQKRPKSVMTFWAFWKVSLFKLKLRWLLFTSTAWKIWPLFFPSSRVQILIYETLWCQDSNSHLSFILLLLNYHFTWYFTYVYLPSERLHQNLRSICPNWIFQIA